jgi:hemerythrin-like metal-binding protein
MVAELLKELIADTAAHVQREEQFMHAIGYPDLAAHKSGHDDFIDDLRALQGKFEAGSITVASQLSSALRDWLSLHIRRYDKDIAHFLHKKKREGSTSRGTVRNG